jgi:hypothetical protein
VGDEVISNVNTYGYLKKSTPAYMRLYKKIKSALVKGEEVTIIIQNI